MDTFRDLLRSEAELRVRILGEDWADAVKDESNWRLSLYKEWLWALNRGIGNPLFPSRSDKTSQQRQFSPRYSRKRPWKDEDSSSMPRTRPERVKRKKRTENPRRPQISRNDSSKPTRRDEMSGRAPQRRRSIYQDDTLSDLSRKDEQETIGMNDLDNNDSPASSRARNLEYSNKLPKRR
jgi:hypothetical protein